ncbi:MAG: BspA family leucine-rich repeat surface protein [Lachnospiraceae bacterium]|nr:BspA family leucine-rich repeat surface protein [Lachnospiraceae bacterium]
MSMGKGRTLFLVMLLLAALPAYLVSANDTLNEEMTLAADEDTEAKIISETESSEVLLDAEEGDDVEVSVAEVDSAETGMAVLNESQTEESQTEELQAEESQVFISDIEEADSADASDSGVLGADEINAIAIDLETSDENAKTADAEESSVLHSGTSGALSWCISADYVLTISGSGDYECDLDKQEWAEYADEIKTAVVDVANITNMYGMFAWCTNLESVYFGDSDFSKVTEMSYMFSECYLLSSVDLSAYDTSSLIQTSYMFYGCSSLSSVNLSGIDTSNLVNIYQMFELCESLQSLDLSSFDTSSVRSSGIANDPYGLLSGCSSLTSIMIPENFTYPASLPQVDGFCWVDEDNEICTEIAAGLYTPMTYYRVEKADSDETATTDENVAISSENFSDEIFRTCISELLDTDNDGILSKDEISAATYLDVSGKEIGSLDGIEYLSALQILVCNDNNLTELDLGSNKKLEKVYCDDNVLSSLDVRGLTELMSLFCENNNLSELDVSRNVNLIKLYCGGNNLSSLDVSHNRDLLEFICSNNNLSSLDVSKNTALGDLDCGYNQLTSLEIGQSEFVYLICNNNNLVSLDVGNAPLVLWMDCHDNQLTSLKLNQTTVALHCNGNNLSSLEVSDAPYLTELVCDDNDLSCLDVSQNTALELLSCSNNQLTSLDISQNTALNELHCSDNHLTSLDISQNNLLWKLDGSNQTHEVSVTLIGSGAIMLVTRLVDQENASNVYTDEDYVSFTDDREDSYINAAISGDYIVFGDNTGEAVCYYDVQGESITGALELVLTLNSGGTDILDLSSCTVDLSDTDFEYDGKEREPETIVKIGPLVLIKDTDYKVSYSNNINPGTATVTIEGTGNCSGSITKTFAIEASSDDAALAGEIARLANVSSGIKITWKETDGATGYKIYRKTGSGSYKLIKTITNSATVSYTDTEVKNKNGITYSYKVLPYSNDGNGTGTSKTIVRLESLKLSTVKNNASKKITVKWKKKSGVTGYQIQYSTSKTFKKGNKTVKVSGAKKTRKVISKLKKGKTYYVRIRTYKKINGVTYYSAWSGKKKVSVRK